MSELENDFENQTIVSTLKETDKKCPDCGGVMDFDPKSGGLKCPYCEHEEMIPVSEEVPLKAEELDFYAAESTANCNWGADKKTVLCKACGAESIYDSLQISAVCPFCGSNQVMEAQTQDTMAPGGVVPFKISDKEASSLFKTWIKKKWFCPKMAKESAKPKSFHGVYLPYWTFDADTTTNYSGRYGRNRTVSDGDGKSHVVTDWHNTSGTYKEKIDDEIVLASKNHDEGILSGLEPFDTENNKSYKPEYVAGFVAERYSVGLKEAWELAKKKIFGRLKDAISHVIRMEKNADLVADLRMNTVYQNITYKYLLLPIWISNYKYKDKVYHFMVNGQTGRVSGKTPISVWKVLLTVFIAIVVVGGIYYLTNYVF